MSKDRPTTVWSLFGTRNSNVRTLDSAHVGIALAPPDRVSADISDDDWLFVALTRHQARMLARRLNECLEATK